MWSFQNVKSEPPNHAFTFDYFTISDGKCKPTFEVYASKNFQWYIEGQYGIYLLFMFLSQRFTIHVQLYLFKWFSLKSVHDCFPYIFPQLWECVWIPRHFPSLFPFSCPSLGCKLKVRIGCELKARVSIIYTCVMDVYVKDGRKVHSTTCQLDH